MVRILFITDNFPPETNAPATRTFEHCKLWARQPGVEVTVVTCFPNFPFGKVYPGYRNKLFQREIIEGVEVIRVWSYLAPNKGFWRRIIDFISFGLMAFIVGVTKKHDVVVATSPQFFTVWAAWGISKLRRKPWVFEVRDLWPAAIKAVGAMSSRPVLCLLERVELYLYKDSHKVIAVTDAMKQDLIARAIEPSHVEVITNGCDLGVYQPTEKDELLVESLRLRGKFVVGYVGTHGLAHGLGFILRSASRLNCGGIHFLFVGDGATKKELVALANELRLTNVSFVDSVPKVETSRYLSVLDVALLPLIRSDVFRKVIPAKLFEAAGMRKPVLLGAEGQCQEIVEHYRAGVCYEPENESSFLSQLGRLKDEWDLYSSCERGCGELALAYDREKLGLVMLSVLKGVCLN